LKVWLDNAYLYPSKDIHSITKRLRTPDEVEQYFPGFLSFIDSTEQQVPRPINKKRRKIYYSGKKKRHTVKSQFMVNNHGIIIHKLGHKKGLGHDYMIFIKITILCHSQASCKCV